MLKIGNENIFTHNKHFLNTKSHNTHKLVSETIVAISDSISKFHLSQYRNNHTVVTKGNKHTGWNKLVPDGKSLLD